MKGKQGFKEIVGKTIAGVVVTGFGQVFLVFQDNTNLEIYTHPRSHVDASKGVHHGGMADVIASVGSDKVLLAMPESITKN